MATDPLAIIAGASPAAAREAMAAMRAQQNSSPMATARAARAARIALDDPQATFTDVERRQIAELLDDRSVDIRLRVTPTEKADVQQRANEANLTVSNYIRQLLDLPLVVPQTMEDRPDLQAKLDDRRNELHAKARRRRQ